MKRHFYVNLLLFLLSFTLWGCTLDEPAVNVNNESDIAISEMVSNKNNADVKDGIVTDIDKTKQKISVYSLSSGTGKSYVYNNATFFKNAEEEIIPIENITLGMVVDVSYRLRDSTIKVLQISKDAWKMESSDSFELDTSKYAVKINGSNYRYMDESQIFSADQKISIDQINKIDELCIRGVGKRIYSIVVTRGHGLLKIVNQDKLLGGWLQINDDIIQTITADMSFVLLEGSYTVNMSKDGVGGTQEINIERDKELDLDASTFNIDTNDYGKVTFVISPQEAKDGAKLTVDDTEYKVDDIVKLKYGYHKVVVESSGYKKREMVIRVEKESLSLGINLESDGSSNSGDNNNNNNNQNSGNNNNNSSNNTNNNNNNTNNNSNNNNNNNKNNDSEQKESKYKITIAAPEDAKVYLDGVYKGMIPVSFEKVTGSHTITLRKDGCKSKTYSLDVKEEDSNSTYSFPELEKDS
ncbi:PEGA domain-containing protein [Acetitomaculum ruminis DSM 5522]|uniref:PEGA domain-containing protein n=1 Tax=Acetitomaculum ruminis DSM 5522 TaxID=1120918 RepID=A0A1I0W1W6_9FIRM|nr:PEGA domain-containing protein [Acetitomaculum ruminis]SFA82689.1 PEGA domain-containing protein [Acetitomaculum ruminis DSM 5522]